MSKQISPSPKLRFFDDNGVPLVGGLLYTYLAGTTTPTDTWTDSTGVTANPNPVVLDARGEADVWLTAAVAYKFILKDADDLTIWTVDDITAVDIYAEDIAWTGDHTFNGTVTLGSVLGAVTFDGAVVIDDTLHVTGATTVDGSLSVGGTLTIDAIDVDSVALAAAGTVAANAGVVEITGASNVRIISYSPTSPQVFNFKVGGRLELANDTPLLDSDAASKKYVDDEVAAAAPAGLIPMCIGAVVSNVLVAGAVGVTSVTRTSTGTYEIVPSSAFTSTGKTIVMTTIRDTTLTKNYCAFPKVNSTTKVTVRTGGGNSFAISDQDFNFVIYSLP